MLTKNKVDKKLKKYINEHLSKGYSKHAVRKVLIDHGYEESYVEVLLRKNYQIKFVKNYAIFVSLFFMIFLLLNVIPIASKQKITGYATIGNGNEGCCTAICQQTYKNECYGKFVENKKCDELQECNVGCCIDKEDYCLTNYLYGNCIIGHGIFTNKDCSDITSCSNLTNRFYLAIKPSAGYYKSAFNILYYLYDKTNVLSILANIKDNKNIIDSITLYDDGSHNDGLGNDNLYGNNWFSSKINAFDGFKKLDVNIVIKYLEGTQLAVNKTRSFVLLNNNKCLPIYTEWSENKKYNIIFAADNYNFSDNYQRFENDVNNFVNVLFSIDKFSNNKDKFNVYRLEQSLSYYNTLTLVNVVSTSCPLYNIRKDLVVVLDNNQDYCIFDRDGVVRINPQVIFYKNITDAEFNESFANFCSYVLTPQKLADEVIAFTSPPRIIVNTLNNITYNVSTVNLSFSISAVNYPINYSLFIDNSLTLNKISNQEVTESIMLNLKNGTNAVLIISSDKNRNSAFSQVLLNVSIK